MGFAKERTVQTMSELKPCPFCGGNNVHNAEARCFGHSSRWAIVCCDCSARVERSTKQKALNAWNRRVDNER